MAKRSPSCPYCNALTPDPGPLAGARSLVVCQRCGERFAYSAQDPSADEDLEEPPIERSNQTSPSAVEKRLEVESPTRARRWSNRAVAGSVLAGMALMAAFGLVYSLMTVSIRRGHDVSKPPPESIAVPLLARLALAIYIVGLMYAAVRSFLRRDAADSTGDVRPQSWRASMPYIVGVGLVLIVAVALTSQPRTNKPTEIENVVPQGIVPAELPGLGYLPDGADVVAGIHVEEILADRRSKPLVDQLLLLVEWLGVGIMEKGTGLALEDYDHLAVGWRAAENMSLVTIVVQTRKAYSPAKVVKTLHATQTSKYGGRALYSFQWEGGREALFWCAGPRTFTIVLGTGVDPASEINQIPAEPRLGAQRLPSSLRPLFKERPLTAGTSFWIAGRARELKPWLALTPLPAETQAHLATVEEFRLGLRLDRDATLTAELHARDPVAATKLFDFLRGQKLGKLNIAAHRSPLNNWVSIQIKAGPDELKKLLRPR